MHLKVAFGLELQYPAHADLRLFFPNKPLTAALRDH